MTAIGVHMLYSTNRSLKEKMKDWVKNLGKDPEGVVESVKFEAKLKMRSLNNPVFAKQIESIFLPSNVIILALLTLSAYIFIFGPGARPTFDNVMWFVVFTSLCYFVMEWISRRVEKNGPEKYNIMSLRITIISLIIPLMLMQTIGLPRLLNFVVVTFLLMSPLIYAIRSKWKISGHMCTFTAMTTIMSMVSAWFAPLYLIIPVISWSRLKLRAHTSAQVFVGTLIGFVMPYTMALLIPLF